MRFDSFNDINIDELLSEPVTPTVGSTIAKPSGRYSAFGDYDVDELAVEGKKKLDKDALDWYRKEYGGEPESRGMLHEAYHAAGSAVKNIIPRGVAQMLQRGNVSLGIDESGLQAFIDEQNADIDARPPSKERLLDTPFTVFGKQVPGVSTVLSNKNIAEGIESGAVSAPISLVGFGAGIPVALGVAGATRSAKAGLAAGATTHSAVSGYMMYQLGKNEFLQNVRNEVKGKVSEEEWEAIKKSVESSAIKSGAYEAGTEAVQSFVEFLLFGAPAGRLITSMLSKGAIERIAANTTARITGGIAKMAATTGLEVGGEGLAEVEQDEALAETPYTGGLAKNYEGTFLEKWGQGMAAVGPQTVISTMMLGGGYKAIDLVGKKMGAARAKTKEDAATAEIRNGVKAADLQALEKLHANESLPPNVRDIIAEEIKSRGAQPTTAAPVIRPKTRFETNQEVISEQFPDDTGEDPPGGGATQPQLWPKKWGIAEEEPDQQPKNIDIGPTRTTPQQRQRIIENAFPEPVRTSGPTPGAQLEPLLNKFARREGTQPVGVLPRDENIPIITGQGPGLSDTISRERALKGVAPEEAKRLVIMIAPILRRLQTPGASPKTIKEAMRMRAENPEYAAFIDDIARGGPKVSQQTIDNAKLKLRHEEIRKEAGQKYLGEASKQDLVRAMQVFKHTKRADLSDMVLEELKARERSVKAIEPQQERATTLAGALRGMGGVNPVNLKTDLLYTHKDKNVQTIIAKEGGVEIEKAEEALRGSGWLLPSENLTDIIENKPDRLRMGKLDEAAKTKFQKEEEARVKASEEADFETPPDYDKEGAYAETMAGDLEEGKDYELVLPSGEYGTFKVQKSEPFGDVELAGNLKIETLDSAKIVQIRAKQDTSSTEIDKAANEAATSPLNDLPQPTEAQKDAGNYQKGHVAVQGLDISIENPAGSIRSGKAAAGKPWSVTLQHNYGYFKRSEGKDGEQIDVIIGPNPESGKAFVVDQINPDTGKFDEHKTLIGFTDQESAEKGYQANYEKDWKGMGAITEMPMDEFKEWVKGGRKTKPISYNGVIPNELQKQAEGQAEKQAEPKAKGQVKGEIKPEVTTVQKVNEDMPGHGLKFDAVQEMMPGQPPMYQFTATEGLAKGATFLTDSLDPEAVKKRLGEKVVEFEKGEAESQAWPGRLSTPYQAASRGNFTKDLEMKGTAIGPEDASFSIQQSDRGGYYYRKIKNGMKVEKGGGIRSEWDIKTARKMAIEDAFGPEELQTEQPKEQAAPPAQQQPEFKIGDIVRPKNGSGIKNIGPAKVQHIVQDGKMRVEGYGAPHWNAEDWLLVRKENEPEAPKPQTKREKSLSEYNDYISSLTDEQKTAAGDLIQDNPESPSSQLLKVKNAVKNAPAVTPKEKPAANIESELESMNMDDIESMFDEVVSEKAAPKKAEPEKIEFVSTSLATGKTEALSVLKTPQPATGKPPAQSAADILKTAAKEGVTGLDEVTKGLFELFGGNALKSFPGGLDEYTYAKAKPHFEAGFKSFVAAGKSLKDFMRWVVDSFGANVKPYLMKWMGDKKAEGLTKQPESGIIKQTATKGGQDEQQIRRPSERVPEGTKTGIVQPDAKGRDVESVPEIASRPSSTRESEPDQIRDERLRSGRDRNQRPPDYSITNKDRLGQGGQKQKFRDNVAAIRALKEIGDGHATPEEQSILAKYVGWGGLPQAFQKPDGTVSKGWEPEAAELKELFTKEEYEAARRSTQDAHYTSQSIIQSIYSALGRMGFTRGKILEPSVGTGNFIGLMPKKFRNVSKITGIELDQTTAAIAKKLYPNQNIVNSGFEKVFITPESYDIAIGNPPFGDKKLFDPDNKDLKDFSIHNFFFAKSLKALRPNGILAMVVSSSMMDKVGTTQRQWINDRAELLGAIRLPNNAFKGNAGTEVTTDIIFLRKREPGERPYGHSWLSLRRVSGEQNDWRINEYFATHPGMMLGRLAPNKLHPADIVDGVYDAVPGMVANEGADLDALLSEAIKELPEKIYKPGKTIADVQKADTVVSDPGFTQPYGYTLDDKGQAVRRLPDRNGEQRYEIVEYAGAPLSGIRVSKFKALLTLRDDIRRLIKAEISDDPKMDGYRKTLSFHYDAFVKEHGYISTDINSQILKDDPSDLPLLRSLEINYDKGISKAVSKSTGQPFRNPSAQKAAVFTTRIREPYREAKTAENAQDGLTIVLREDGIVNIDRISELTGKSVEETTQELEKIIFLNPDTEAWETADAYLGGDVKKKLHQAEMAAQKDHRYQINVEELKKVQPEDVPPDLIAFSAGASWIPERVYEQFASEHLGSDVDIVHFEKIGSWSAKVNREGPSQYGTERMSGIDIYLKMVQGKEIAVYDVDPDGRRWLNIDETTHARNKAAEINRIFKEWVLSDTQRRDLVAKVFNDKVNTTIESQFNGSHMIFPGMGIINTSAKRDEQLRTHQKNAVWRLIQKGKGLLDHVVGSGKTFIAVSTGLEMKRMGLVKKPMYVVPNHLVGQWATDFQRLYPGSNVLAIGKKDFAKKRRQEFLARIATGNWDAVLIAHSSFGFIKMPYEYEQKFYQDQIDQYEQAIVALKESDGEKAMSVKQMEKAKDKLVEKMAALASAPKENVVDFSELGVDSLFVDEAHEFKNLFYATRKTRVAGLGNPTGSKKAFEMFVKTQFVQDANNGRGVFFLTGTPISNSISEMFTMMRYLDYQKMGEIGITHFDQWANMFAESISDWEVDPTGTRYRLQTKLEFVNLPGLMSFYKDFADVVSTDDLKKIADGEGTAWPIPKIEGGKPELIVAERSDLQKSFTEWVVHRFDNMPKDPRTDNPLKATGEAMKAALDIRLINEHLPDNTGSKVNMCVDNVHNIYSEWSNKKGTQLIFCDLSVPKNNRGKHVEEIKALRAEMKALEQQMTEETDEDALLEIEEQYNKVADKFEKYSPAELMAADSNFSVYDDIKSKLISKGIPASEIAFIHDANTEDQKYTLFGNVRTGNIRVLIGSTSKMGTGMNVQNRLVALHHLDAPWRPSDLEQREGRIIRQGNEFFEKDPAFEVKILRYATKETLDTRRWQVIERKARTIQQLRSGDHKWGEKIDDAMGEAANAAEMKAASSGNPLILEEIQTRKDLEKLEIAKRNARAEKFRYEGNITKANAYIDKFDSIISEINADADLIEANPKDRTPQGWKISIGDEEYKAIGLVEVPKGIGENGTDDEIKADKKAIKDADEHNKEALKRAKEKFAADLKKTLDKYTSKEKKRPPGTDIQYRGVNWDVSESHWKGAQIQADLSRYHIRETAFIVDGEQSPEGLLVRMDNVLDHITDERERSINSQKRTLEQEQNKKAIAEKQLQKDTVNYDQEIEALRRRHAEIIEGLKTSRANDDGEKDFSMWENMGKPGNEVLYSINDKSLLNQSQKDGSIKEKNKEAQDALHRNPRSSAERDGRGVQLERIYRALQAPDDGTTKIVAAATKEQRVIQRIAERFNTTPVFWKQAGLESHQVNGFTSPDDPNTFYINVNSPNPLLAIAGHETLHLLSLKHPDIYNFIVKTLTSKSIGFGAYMDNLNAVRKQNNLPELNSKFAFAEFLADFTGDQFTKPEFWEKLHEKSPSFTRKIIDVVKDILDKIKKTLRLFNSENAFPDIGYARNVLANAMAEFAEREKGRVDINNGTPGTDIQYSLTKTSKQGSIQSTDPEVEARIQEARKGIGEDPRGVIERVKDSIVEKSHGFTRQFIELEPNRENAKAIEWLQQLRDYPATAISKSVGAIDRIVKGLSPGEFEIFERKVLLDDLAYEVEQGHDLPFGFTPDLIKTDRAMVDAAATLSKNVRDALGRRKEYIDTVTADLVSKGILDESEIKNPAYFRHMVLQFARERQFVQGKGRNVKKPKPGYAMKREGSELDINANYFEAEFEFLHRALVDIKTAETLEKVRATYDIVSELREKAKELNDEALKGMGVLNISKMKEADKMAALGDKFKTWRDIIPEGFKTWQADKGLAFHTGHGITDKAVNLILGALMDPASFTTEEVWKVAAGLRERLIVTGKKPEMVLPEGLARTLDNLRPPNDRKFFDELFSKPLGMWKQWVLINPRRILKYNLNNLSGDLDAVFAGNPKVLKRLPQAIQELWQVMHGAEPSVRYQEAIDRGVFSSGITIQEIPEISKLSEFQALVSGKMGKKGVKVGILKAWRFLKDYTQFRENWLRYAAYLDYVERLEAGESMKSIGYGAALPAMVDGIDDLKDKSALLARRLVGDYGAVSHYGRDIRNKIIPFYSWLEINFRRYSRLIANAYEQGIGEGLKTTGTIGVFTGARVSAYLAIRMAVFYGLVQLWNNIVHGDDEDRLSAMERAQMHLTLGHDEDGNVYSLRIQGALSDYMDWIGVSDVVEVMKEIAQGRGSVKDIFIEIAKAPINKIMSGLTPMIKTPIELASKRSMYPDVFNPRVIQDRKKELARLFSLENEYDWATGKPSKGYGESWINSVTYRRDVGEISYYSIKDKISRWNQARGFEFDGFFTSPKSEALRDYKLAIRYGDDPAKDRAWSKLRELGVTKKDVFKSIKRAAPLAGLSEKNRVLFKRTLSEKDRVTLGEAETWYRKIYLNGNKEGN